MLEVFFDAAKVKGEVYHFVIQYKKTLLRVLKLLAKSNFYFLIPNS
ncbi:hypothetical protein CAPSP0001_2274 [Capnocytophaga sputigena ATCC 33612]|nr:hypothetical protein CAPSP0001_2274 [Capnocytophaga sputigena ATCC 33612]